MIEKHVVCFGPFSVRVEVHGDNFIEATAIAQKLRSKLEKEGFIIDSCQAYESLCEVVIYFAGTREDIDIERLMRLVAEDLPTESVETPDPQKTAILAARRALEMTLDGRSKPLDEATTVAVVSALASLYNL